MSTGKRFSEELREKGSKLAGSVERIEDDKIIAKIAGQEAKDVALEAGYVGDAASKAELAAIGAATARLTVERFNEERAKSAEKGIGV